MTENQISDLKSPFDPQAILVDLNIEKNRLAPISKIPPEILADIFVMTSRLFRNLEWIKLTYVCHDWRCLALNSPILWTDLPFRNTLWCKEMLLRSKEATLRIEPEGPMNDRQFSNFLNIVKNHMSRIGSIKTSDANKRLLECLPESAPRLESLVMTSVFPLRLGEAMNLLKNSLCNVPRLRQMELEFVGIDWEKHLPSSITFLRLRQTPQASLPTSVQVWDALERMPLLEILELSDALPTSSCKIPNASNRAIVLGYLRELKLDSGIAEIKSFLNTITFPPTACVKIGCHRIPAEGYNDLAGSLVLLGQWLTEGRSAQIESLNIEFLNEMKIGFFTSDNGPQKYPLEFSVSMGGRTDPATEPMLTNIFQVFAGSLAFVNELTVNGPSRLDLVSSSIILNTFGSLPELRKMTITVGSPTLDALRSKLPFAGNSAQSRVSFPSLQSLIMEETWFTEDPNGPSTDITVQNLRDCLAWREKQGARLKLLEAKDCICLEEKDCDPLRDVVDEFKWSPRQWFICG